MKKMILYLFILSIFGCTSQKGACENEVKVGEDTGTCSEASLYFIIGSSYLAPEGKRNLFNDLANFQLLRCLRYTQALRECKDYSTVIPALK